MCLFIYDEDTDDITWMLHTTTGGDISASRESVPETAWALHPTLPLLAWLLPGHRLRISNIEGHAAPLTIAGKSSNPLIGDNVALNIGRVSKYRCGIRTCDSLLS